MGKPDRVNRFLFALLLPSSGCYGGITDFGPPGESQGTGHGVDDSTTDSGGGGQDDDGATPGGGDDDGGGGELQSGQDSRFPRLSHFQWENTVRDLFYLDQITGISSNFVDDPSAAGFNNQGMSFEVGSTLWGDYQRAGEAVAELITGDPTLLSQITPPDTGQSLEERGRQFITEFGLRAYRRPLQSEEIDSYVSLFIDAQQNYSNLDPFAAGVHMVIQTTLQSPHFLYRIVDGEANEDGLVPLNAYERAARLSYALWNTMPDDELFAAAADGSLDTKEELIAQTERLIDHPRARAMSDDFHSQLLQLDKYLDQYRNPDFFPDFDPAIGEVMQRETKMFIQDIIFERHEGYTEMLTAPYTFANDQLASTYGLDAGLGPDLVRVDLDPTQRGGLLTHAGFLMARSYQVDPDPIHRGAFISFELLCNVAPPVPDNVTAVEPDPTKTNRERVNDHTGPGTCAEGCHTVLINDAGFAFESYDATGTWRTIDNGHPVDSTGSFMVDDEVHSYDNGVEFSQIIADSHQAHACYSRHIVEYLHGRKHREADEDELASMGERSRNGELSIREMMIEVVTSEEFLNLRQTEDQ